MKENYLGPLLPAICMAAVVVGILTFAYDRAAFAAGPYDFAIKRVVDGDTVEFYYPELPVELGDTLLLRIYGIDTPEKDWRAKCMMEAAMGNAATSYAKDLIRQATVVQITLRKWDKFGGRVVGEVLLDGQKMSQKMIAAGYAKPYFGKKKESWCTGLGMMPGE